MNELYRSLSNEEIDRLDRFLLDRIDEETDTEGKDEGVLDVSTLDGLLTAVVSSPVMVPPSQWLPAVWGDFEPLWESEDDFKEILSLMMRHMNGISGILMQQPEDFEPIFLERTVKGKTYTIVDEWCEGYMRGVSLAAGQWDLGGGKEMMALLAPILGFTSASEWWAHNQSEEDCDIILSTITPNVKKIHAYWLERREDLPPVGKPVRRSGPQVGRNDPCPCGSGRKFKKCCLQ